MSTHDIVDGQFRDVDATVMQAVIVYGGTQDARIPVNIEILHPDRVKKLRVHQDLAKLLCHGVQNFGSLQTGWDSEYT